MLSPTRNNILFAFFDETTNGKFFDTSDGGIILGKATVHDMMEQARWVRVLAVGPDVTEVAIGDVVLIEPLMWTEGFTHDYVEIWKTDETKILAIKEKE